MRARLHLRQQLSGPLAACVVAGGGLTCAAGSPGGGPGAQRRDRIAGAYGGSEGGGESFAYRPECW